MIGQNALELARAIRLPLIPVFPEGKLPADDPIGRQIAATLIQSVLPARGAMDGPSAVIVPGNSTHIRRDPTEILSFTDRVLTLRGAECTPLHAGTATILAELNATGFTGVGMSLGAAKTSLSIAVHGRPVIELTYDRGMSSVDEVFARSRGRFLFDTEGNRYLDTRSVAEWRETAGIDLSAPVGDDQELLRSLVREWLLGALGDFTQKLELDPFARRTRGASILVLSGGPTRMAGFDVLVADAVTRAQLPLTITEVRTGAASDFVVARGGLIAAQLERQVLKRQSA